MNTIGFSSIEFPVINISSDVTAYLDSGPNDLDTFWYLDNSNPLRPELFSAILVGHRVIDSKGDIYTIAAQVQQGKRCELLYIPIDERLSLQEVKECLIKRFKEIDFNLSEVWESKTVAECFNGKEGVIACMEYPLLDISVNSWDINCLCDTILLDCTMNANEYQSKYHQHIVMDCKGVVFTIENWKSGGWKSLLPWRKNAQLLFDTTAIIMTLDEVKTFLIGKLHLLQTADKEACEGYITNLTTIRNVVIFWSFYVQGKVDFGK